MQDLVTPDFVDCLLPGDCYRRSVALWCSRLLRGYSLIRLCHLMWVLCVELCSYNLRYHQTKFFYFSSRLVKCLRSKAAPVLIYGRFLVFSQNCNLYLLTLLPHGLVTFKDLLFMVCLVFLVVFIGWVGLNLDHHFESWRHVAVHIL